jgi:hypothetical protein
MFSPTTNVFASEVWGSAEGVHRRASAQQLDEWKSNPV